MPMSALGAEIIAIDDTDRTGWLECATTVGEVAFQTVATFVDRVIAALGARKMSLLHLQVHGSPDAVWFGTEEVSMATFGNFEATFRRLASKFESGAWVDLRACLIGQNLPLLHRF